MDMDNGMAVVHGGRLGGGTLRGNKWNNYNRITINFFK